MGLENRRSHIHIPAMKPSDDVQVGFETIGFGHDGLLCSPGFGPHPDADDIFADITAALPNAIAYLPDYSVRGSDGTFTPRPLDDQTSILTRLLGHMLHRKKTIVAHSMGAIAVSQAQIPEEVDVVLIAPPPMINPDRFESRVRRVSNEEGSDLMMQQGGRRVQITERFLQSLRNTPIDCVLRFLSNRAHRNYVIWGAHDGYYSGSSPDEMRALLGERFIEIEGDHFFKEDHRIALIERIKRLFAEENPD